METTPVVTSSVMPKGVEHLGKKARSTEHGAWDFLCDVERC